MIDRTTVVLVLILVSIVSISAGRVNAAPVENGKFRTAAPLGWGFEVGRATEGDVEALLADQLKLKREFDRMGKIGNGVLGKERIKEILVDRGSSDETIDKLLSTIDKWWKVEIDEPIRRIANNPAASCEEASDMVRIVLERNRQRVLIGGEPDTLAFAVEIFNDVQKRCHDEALDECNATGRYDHILRMMLTEVRQVGLLGGYEKGDWIGPVLKECAIYQVHYVSTTDIDDELKIHSVIDGRITLNPVIKGDDGPAIMNNLKFEGEIMRGDNPFLQKLDCSAADATVTCSPGGDPKKSAYAKIAKMTLRSKEFYVDESGNSKSRPVGEDFLEMIFSPAMLAAAASIKMPDTPPLSLPFLEIGGTGFHIAHQKSMVENGMFKFTENRRTGYPILFEFTRQGKGLGEDVPGSDSTVFQIIHKPNKQPFPARSTPKRVPLKPKQ